MIGFFSSFVFVWKACFQFSAARKSLLCASVLFSFCVLMIFPLVLGPQIVAQPVFALGILWSVCELAAGLLLQQVLQYEHEAGILEPLWASGLSHEAFFLAKVFFMAFILWVLQWVIVCMWIGLYNLPMDFVSIFVQKCFWLHAWFCLGTASLMVVVAFVTWRSLHQGVLQPVLFFPLHVSFVLAWSQLCLHAVRIQMLVPDQHTAWLWLFFMTPLLLMAFGVLVGKKWMVF